MKTYRTKWLQYSTVVACHEV